MSKKRLIVVAPGRGSYTAETLGFLKKHKSPQAGFLADLDGRRRAIGEPTISELDNAAKFSPSLHMRGEHASPLIYACAYHDFMALLSDENKEKYEVVAICGNSMGWYLAMAFAGALDHASSFQLIQTMGSMMKTEIIGGQMIYPVLDDNWQPDYERERVLLSLIERVQKQGLGQAYISIWLGGYYVVGGDQAGLSYLMKNLPKAGDYPFQLIHHAAFHTPLLYETSKRAFEIMPRDGFGAPHTPLIDGRGVIWQPYSTDVEALYQYTLGHQVYQPYDFTASVTVAIKEFAPDAVCLLGPGAGLSGAIGQVFAKNRWRGVVDKTSFKAKAKELLLLSADI